MSASAEAEEPIFDLATECEKLFDQQIQRLQNVGEKGSEAVLTELRQRFANWAAFLGVWAESKICLDRRLKHHLGIQDQVLRLLDIIAQNLAYCKSQAL